MKMRLMLVISLFFVFFSASSEFIIFIKFLNFIARILFYQRFTRDCFDNYSDASWPQCCGQLNCVWTDYCFGPDFRGYVTWILDGNKNLSDQ